MPKTVAAIAVLMLSFSPLRVWAAAETGACCLGDAVCEDLIDFQCDDADGRFIGTGTTCASVNCNLPLTAPVLSIAGVIAVLAAVTGIGVRRIVKSHRG